MINFYECKIFNTHNKYQLNSLTHIEHIIFFLKKHKYSCETSKNKQTIPLL